MRTILQRLIFGALILLAGVSFAEPLSAQYCRCECYRVPGGRVCRQVCYAPPQPRYEPPRYSAPYQSYSAPAYSAPDPAVSPELADALLLLLGVGAAISLIAVLAQVSSIASVHSEMAAVQEDTIATRDLANHADVTAQEIDAFVEHSAREHYARGRAAADEEWTRG